MGECRNCGRQNTKDLGFIGEIAPFFLKRVMNLDYGLAPSAHRIKRLLRNIAFVSKAFQKVYAKSVLVEMQICERCLFIQTKRPFSDDAIGNLYADYRSDSYNRERIHYEPEYASIAPHMAGCAHEVQRRKVGLTQWLTGKLNPKATFSMLDYGGADGMFLPDLPGQKFVFDISDIAPATGITRVNESELSSYSYIQLAHVLEHVPFPLALATKSASFLENSGYLYIEVPQELSDDSIAGLANGDGTIHLTIHEHINQYCQQSVAALLQSLGLSPVAIQSEFVDFGWNKGTIIRALGRKC